ncbi:MAG: 5-(carboxyamino)imidazole ribonucleotide synthase [Verrucomicrobiota bacterium]|nr:5-(carboxyamino)imidazole ribonucleotide synthase [Verrucomicrobiota bacterium]
MSETSKRPSLGIIGGGQLAKMLGTAAIRLGCRVAILSDSADCPAKGSCSELLVGSSASLDSLKKLAGSVDVLTLENEFVDSELLRALEGEGTLVFPTAQSIALVQDKLLQKRVLAEHSLPVPEFEPLDDFSAMKEIGQRFGYPFLLKKRRNGYDGKGNFTVRSQEDISKAWKALNGDQNGLYAERFFPFNSELAIMISRSKEGTEVAYPVVETIQKEHICHIVKAPAQFPRSILEEATSLARQAVRAFNGIGSFGVEMFLGPEGNIVINEMAPRVHNSGHYTIEACECSQFENHIRAVLGWPLGSSAMLAEGAAMVNLLGAGDGTGWPQGIEKALGIPGAFVHLYGKEKSSVARKMGHVTALGSNVGKALQKAERAANALQFGNV